MKILVPSLGESVTEATVAKWLKNTGETVSKDEVLVELETDKATLEVYAQSNGCLLYTSPSPRDRSVSRMPSSA